MKRTAAQSTILLAGDDPVFAALARQRPLVLVFEDLTHLQRAQRAVAWREVARRIAHEIKNPLTPIQLSMYRLRKNLEVPVNRSPCLAFTPLLPTVRFAFDTNSQSREMWNSESTTSGAVL